MVWFIKIWKGECGPVLHNLVHDMYNDDETWYLTGFFKPAYDMLIRIDRDLLTDCEKFPSTKVAAERLKDMLFAEVNEIWSTYEMSVTTREIHPVWKSRKLAPVQHSFLTAVSVHKLALGRGNLAQYNHRCGRTCSPNCSFCPGVVENLNHIFCHCNTRKPHLRGLRHACKRLNIAYELKTLFTDERLRPELEKTILKLEICTRHKHPK